MKIWNGFSFNDFKSWLKKRPLAINFSRTSLAYDKYGNSIPAGQARFDDGFLIEESTTNLFTNTLSQTFNSSWTSGTLNGTYTVKINGSSGSLTLSGGAKGTLKAGESLTFIVTNNKVTFTPSGDPKLCQLENKAYPTSWTLGGTTRNAETYNLEIYEDLSNDNSSDGISSNPMNGWIYYKLVPYTESSVVNVYGFYVLTVTIPYETVMRTDFGDIRFTSEDGNTIYSHNIVSKTDGVTATFDIRIPSQALNSQMDIKMWVGNLSATDVSDPNAVYLFYDYFSGNLSKWTLRGGNSISNGELLISDPDAGVEAPVTLRGGFLVETRIKVAQAFPQRRICVSSESGYNCFWIQFTNNAIQNLTNGEQSDGYISGIPLPTGQYNTFKFARDENNNGYMYVNGVMYHESKNWMKPDTNCKISIGTETGICQTYVDYVYIKPFLSSEPTLGTIPSTWSNTVEGSVMNLNCGTIEVEFYANKAFINNSITRYIFTLENAEAANSLRLTKDTSGNLSVLLQYAGNSASASGNYIFSEGERYKIRFTWDSTKAKLFLNGIQVGNTISNPQLPVSYNLNIGANSSGNSQINTYMRNIIILDTIIELKDDLSIISKNTKAIIPLKKTVHGYNTEACV